MLGYKNLFPSKIIELWPWPDKKIFILFIYLVKKKMLNLSIIHFLIQIKVITGTSTSHRSSKRGLFSHGTHDSDSFV